MRKPPRSLKKRENILERAALVARLNTLGETRRAQVLQRNAINEEEKRRHTYARDSPAYAASFEHGHRMRENEARLAHTIRAAMTPRGMTPGGMTTRGIATPLHMLRPFAPMTPGYLPPLGELPPAWRPELNVAPTTPRSWYGFE